MYAKAESYVWNLFQASIRCTSTLYESQKLVSYTKKESLQAFIPRQLSELWLHFCLPCRFGKRTCRCNIIRSLTLQFQTTRSFQWLYRHTSEHAVRSVYPNSGLVSISIFRASSTTIYQDESGHKVKGTYSINDGSIVLLTLRGSLGQRFILRECLWWVRLLDLHLSYFFLKYYIMQSVYLKKCHKISPTFVCMYVDSSASRIIFDEMYRTHNIPGCTSIFDRQFCITDAACAADFSSLAEETKTREKEFSGAFSPETHMVTLGIKWNQPGCQVPEPVLWCVCLKLCTGIKIVVVWCAVRSMHRSDTFNPFPVTVLPVSDEAI